MVFSIYQTAFQFSKWGLAAAMGVGLMAVIAVVSLFQSRFWRSTEI